MAIEELRIRIGASAKEFTKEIDKVKGQTKELEQTLSTTARNAAIAFAGFATVIGGTTKAFADFETALVGVSKTTGIGGTALDAFGDQILALSTTIPVAANDLLGIAQVAGQLGVNGADNLVKFTDTIAKLGFATDLSGEEAAAALTRILTVTKEGVGEIDTFGSVIVELGNNFAATESEIVSVATRVAQSTAVFKLGSTNVAGISTALKALGVEAELGGSAVGRAFVQFEKAINNGGTQLDKLSQLTGLTGEAIAKTFGEDPTKLFQRFVEGLGRVNESGGSVAASLASIGLPGVRLQQVFGALSTGSDVLANALNLANEEAKNATALNNEAAKAFDTLNARFDIARNKVINAASALGEKLAPAVTQVVNGVGALADRFSKLDDSQLEAIAGFLKAGAAVTGTVAALATLALGIVKISGLLTALKGVLRVSRIAFAGFWGAATFGIGTVLAFLPEIISGFQALFDVITDDGPQKTIEDLNSEISDLEKDRLDAVKKLEEAEKARLNGSATLAQRQISNIDKEISKLKQLQAEQAAFGELSTEDKARTLGIADDVEQAASFVVTPDKQLLEINKQAEVLQEKQAKENQKQNKIREQQIKDEIEKEKKALELQRKNIAFREEQRQKDIDALSSGGIVGIFAALKSRPDVFNEKGELTQAGSDFSTAEKATAITSNALSALGQGAEGARQAVIGAAQVIGEKLLPGFGQAIAQAVEVLSQQPEELRKNILAFFGEIPKILRSIVENSLRTVGQTVISQLAELTDAVLETVAIAITTLFESIPELIDVLAEEVGPIVEAIVERVPEIVQALVDGLGGFSKRLADSSASLITALVSQSPQISSALASQMPGVATSLAIELIKIQPAIAVAFAQALIREAPSIGRAIVDSVRGAPVAIGQGGAGAVGALPGLPGFFRGGLVKAQGGGIPGMGGRRDRIPALLEPGELVVPRNVVPDFNQAIGNQATRDAANATGETVIRVEGEVTQNDAFMSDLIEGIASKVRNENADLGV